MLLLLLYCAQKNYSGQTSLDYAQMGVFAEMSEAEVLNTMMRGHESMMAVLTSRHRSLQIIYSLWHNKDMKVTCIIYIVCLYYTEVVGKVRAVCVSR